MITASFSRSSSKKFLVSAIAIFAASELVAYAIDLWLMANQTSSGLSTYNNWLGNVPGGMAITATIFLAIGILNYPKRINVFIIAAGIFITALSFVLAYSFGLTFKIEYYPGYYYSLIDGPVANLYYIGMGSFLASLVALVLHGALPLKRNVSS